MLRKWENVHYQFPVVVNPLVANIRSKMEEMNLTQKSVARMIGIKTGII